jgi:predicted phage terminase large subunit-like protein
LNIPCECVDPENDPLGRELGDGPCPEIGKGRTWVQAFKQAYIRKGNLMTWENNYQGNPTIANGNLFKEKYFRTCEFGKITDRGLLRPNGKTTVWPCIALSLDAAMKDEEDNDFNALQVWAKLEDDYFLLHAEKEHYSFPDLIDRIYALMRRFNIRYLYIEEAANGVATIQMLNKAKVKGVVGVQPEGGKYSRAMAVTWLFHQGHCYFDKDAEYFDEYKKSLCAFPKGTHDDDVDATSQALNRMSMLAVHESVAEVIVGKKCEWDDDMVADYMQASTIERRAMVEAWGDPPANINYRNGASLDLMGS